MSDLDFSELSDDQIVGLATALANEALRRSPALAAAFKDTLITEKERVEAAAKGAAKAKKDALDRAQQLQQRIEAEHLKELERQKTRSRTAGLLIDVARIVERDVTDVTLILTSAPSGIPRLYLNPGTDTNGYGSFNLVQYDIGTKKIRTSWKLDAKKKELLKWAETTVAALRAMQISSITVKGIEL